MTHLPYDDVDYCEYGVLQETYQIMEQPRQKKSGIQDPCKKDCNSMSGNIHKEQAQRYPPSKAPAEYKQSVGQHTQSELYVVPQDLITEIFESISTH